SLTSRELRQVLQNIKGYSEILRTRSDKLTSKDQDRCFTLLNKNILRLERFVGSIDELNSIEKYKLVLASVNFTDLIETVFDPYKMKLGEQFQYKIINRNMKNSSVVVDSERIAQALDIIIKNAIDHTPKDQRQITVTCNLTDAVMIYITISDNGAGIAAENLERVMEPFFSAPSQYSIGGTGIGLYISHMILKNHNGTISIESNGIGKGTTVKLSFPRS
ncbi:MAG: sensor histidine kinase, partial [Candidatus Hodarchaeales archaeon]